MELLFATGNAGKLREVREICDALGREYGISITVNPMPDKVDIPEDGLTYEENAAIKAEYVYRRYGKACIADDSGMEVDALGGGPGIHTARYCDRNFSSGIDKLLFELQRLGALSPQRRRASFECCICLIANEKKYFFHGQCLGTISLERRGTEGFGFDPVFIADSTPGRCMAELPDEEKNTLSHRGLAMREMFRFMKENNDEFEK